MGRCTFRCASRLLARFTSTATATATAQKSLHNEREAASKALESILEEMERRKVEYIHTINADRKINLEGAISYPRRLNSFDLQASPAVGDLFVSRGNEIGLVLENLGNESYTICKVSGVLAKVSARDLVMKLGRAVDPKVLKDCTRIVTIDGTEEKILLAQLAGPINSLLREFKLSAETLRKEIKPALGSLVDQIRTEQKYVTNVPFFELARQLEFYSKEKKALSLRDSSVRALFGKMPVMPQVPEEVRHTVDALYVFVVYTLLNQFFFKSILFDNTADRSQLQTLSILPSDWNWTKASDRSQLRMILESKRPISDIQYNSFTELVRRYALDDISKNDSESRSNAVLGLRQVRSLNDQEIGPDLAVKLLAERGLVNTAIGPFFDQVRFEFLKKHASTISQFEAQIPEIDTVAQLRTDFGDTKVYCIDAEGAYEIDDGISVRLKTGNIATVSVHIADPISAVDSFTTSPDLINAYRTSSTAYFPVGAVPMLHHKFSQVFSLTAGQSKRAITFSFDFDLGGDEIVDKSFKIEYHSIRNIHKITYDAVDEILDKKTDDSPVAKDLALLSRISNSMFERREGKGAVRSFGPQASVKVDLSSRTPKIELEVREDIVTPSQRLVSEMMVTANSLVARYTKQNSIPSIYRSQSSGIFDEILDTANEDQKQRPPSFESAVVSPVSKPHYSLALDDYSHTTSPLRRFQDLLVHWQLRSHLLEREQDLFTNLQLVTMSVRIQSLQQLIKEAQKKSLKYWILRKLEQMLVGKRQLKLSCKVIREPVLSSFEKEYQQVYCEDLGLSIPLTLEGHKPYPVDTQLRCEVVELNPWSLKVAVKVV